MVVLFDSFKKRFVGLKHYSSPMVQTSISLRPKKNKLKLYTGGLTAIWDKMMSLYEII